MEETEIVFADTFVNFPTVTAQQKGISHGRFYTKPQVVKARQWFKVRFLTWASQMRENFPDISDKPYLVEIAYFYKIKSPKKLWGKFKTTRPDIDNQTKLILDAITDTGLFWDDDGQVVKLHLTKRYSEINKVSIIIGVIKENE